MEYPGFAHWDKMSQAQQEIMTVYRQDTKELAALLMSRIEAIIPHQLFGASKEERAKPENSTVVHGCNKWMMNTIDIYFQMLQQLVVYASDEDRNKFYAWHAQSHIKINLS